MITKIADYIYSVCKNEFDYDSVYFAVKVTVLSLMQLLTILIIGILFNQLASSILFSIMHIILRSYAGGFHMDTSKNCYIISLFIFIAVMCIFKLNIICGYSITASAVIYSICALIICFAAPVENKNKPLDKKELFVYKIITVLIMAVYTLLMLIGIWFKIYNLVSVIIAVVFLECCLLLVGLFKNRQQNQQNN